MRLPFILFLLVSLSTCSKETVEPVEQEAELYYLVIRFGQDENAPNLKEVISTSLRSLGNYRISTVYMGDDNQEASFTIRRCHSPKQAKKLLAALRKEPDFEKREMRIVSQRAYREMLKKRSFYGT
jgi:hypothetical protein